MRKLVVQIYSYLKMYTLFIIFIWLFSTNHKALQNPDSEKLSAYECGFELYEDSRHVFDIRFYVIAVLFVIFDIEMLFLLPWSVSVSKLDLLGFWSRIDFLFELGLKLTLYLFKQIFFASPGIKLFVTNLYNRVYHKNLYRRLYSTGSRLFTFLREYQRTFTFGALCTSLLIGTRFFAGYGKICSKIEPFIVDLVADMRDITNNGSAMADALTTTFSQIAQAGYGYSGFTKPFWLIIKDFIKNSKDLLKNN
jgi:NADH:ubiquinone oxidoreductase subunit 3 (subunit A)